MSKRISKRIFVGLAALVVAGCAGQQQGSAFDVEDRLAIIDLLNSYSHNIDHGLVDEYAGLFTEDAVFEIHFPGAPPSSFNGHEQVRSLAEGAKAMRASGIQRRHRLTNIIFHEQTDISASISCYLMLTNTANEQDLSLAFTGQYDGWLVKGDDGWQIGKWVLTSDSGITAPAPSEELGSDAT